MWLSWDSENSSTSFYLKYLSTSVYYCFMQSKIQKNQFLWKTILFLLFIFASSWTIYSVYRIITSIAPDFSVFYLTAKDLFSGNNPYQNSKIFTGLGYPPNTLLFYLPFIFFSQKLAQTLFTLISLSSIIAAVYISLKLAKNKFNLLHFILFLSLTLLSFPTKFTLGMGQNNAVALLLLLLSFHYHRKNNYLFSGIILGLAIALKSIFGFFFLFYILKKRWKILAYASSTILATIIITISISDANLYQYWITKVIPPLLNLKGREIYYNQGILGFISRFSDNLFIRRYLSLLVSLVTLTITTIFAMRKKNEAAQFSLFLITLVLIDTLSWQHHFIWLIFPYILISNFILKSKHIRLYILILTSYFLVSWNIKEPNTFSTFPSSLILSNTFFGTVLLFFLNVIFLSKKTSSKKNNSIG